MNGELVRVQTADNVHLHGLVLPSKARGETTIDAAVFIHGLAGNFYGSRLDEYVASEMHQCGITVARINTRGHDNVNQTSKNGQTVTQGAAYEIVDDCRYDVRAWCDFLVERGHQRLLLMGHSLGAIKSIYSQALDAHPNVVGIVAISASRLSYEKFLDLPTAIKLKHWLKVADAHIAASQGETLLAVDFPFPTLISAAAYRDKYGEADRYNWLKYIQQVNVPTLLTFGSRELAEHSAFIDILNDIEQLNLDPSLFEIGVIEGANHFYVARLKLLGDQIVKWLRNHDGVS
ncbi:MAG TPA: alpha/beta hydrolase [Pirellulaceae bacterium]|nr:alpha/beta hydrolase [Pirellulaceae bacterium]HMO92505.1 alpha/beta hydrolase [Pirellulaceae bacterium]HMP69012.1 alpha/beta hydrolase [Pirellulaceae bacterium]